VPCRDHGRAALRTGLIALLGVVPATLLAEADAGGVPAWKSRVEFVTQLLQDDQGRVVLDHAAALGTDAASLNFQYDDGGALTLSLDHGSVVVAGHPVGDTPPAGHFRSAGASWCWMPRAPIHRPRWRWFGAGIRAGSPGTRKPTSP